MTPKLGSSLQPNTESPRGKGEKKKQVKQTLLADPSQFGSKWENMSLLLIWNDDIVTTLLSGCSYLWHCRVAIVLANEIFFFLARISTAEHKNEYFLCRTCGNESLPLLHSFMCSSQLLQFCYASAASISAIGKGWRDIKGEIAKAKAIPHGINVLRL